MGYGVTILIRLSPHEETKYRRAFNTEKTKYMVMSRHQNAGQNHNLLTANKYTESLAKFNYLGTTATNQN
jgi:hypothetical protein